MGKRDGHRNFENRELPQSDSKRTVSRKGAPRNDTSVQTNGPTADEEAQKKIPTLIKSLTRLRISEKREEEQQKNMVVSN